MQNQYSNRMLPCPFCGNDKLMEDQYIRDGREVGCGVCNARVYAYNPDANEKAVGWWNKRELMSNRCEHGKTADERCWWCNPSLCNSAMGHTFVWRSDALMCSECGEEHSGMVVRPANGNDSLYVPKAQYEATRTSLEQDCEAWRKAAVKAEKRDSLNLKAFSAYIRDQQDYALTDEEVSEIIGQRVENEEAPL